MSEPPMEQVSRVIEQMFRRTYALLEFAKHPGSLILAPSLANLVPPPLPRSEAEILLDGALAHATARTQAEAERLLAGFQESYGALPVLLEGNVLLARIAHRLSNGRASRSI